MSPFLLTYGQEAKLPLDDHVDQQDKNLIDRIHLIIEKLPEIREKAKQTMIAVKNKQKTAHDKQMVKPKSFDIGQKVLYYDTAKMNQFLGKLELKWKGPYRIHEVLINGSYKLREIDG